MKKIPYKDAKKLWPYRNRLKGNFKGQDENHNEVYHRIVKQAYQTYADGYCPMKPVRGRRARDTRYKDRRKGKL